MSSIQRKRKPELRGEATVAALRLLDPSGKEGSFEQLVVLLVAGLIGQPLRRALAGSQDGKDALSDDGSFAIECKRYLASTRLSARELISELEEVRARHRDLQLWILATTTALGATEKEKLDEAAQSKGLAVLHLDTASTSPFLDATYAIAALCATNVESTLRFFSGTDHKASRQRIRKELEAIRNNPKFAGWTEWLREEIQNRLPIWRFVTERQNLALAKRISETAYSSFGTRYDADIAVRRQARAQLDEWFRSALKIQDTEVPPLAVVVGERYDGKTWMVYQWLSEVAKISPVPIFFVGSARGMQSTNRLIGMQIEDLAPALKRDRFYAESFVHNYRDRAAGKGPWALVVLDGLNEYAPNHGAWLRHLEVALGRGEAECRPAAVLLTVRARSWPEMKGLLPYTERSAGIVRPFVGARGLTILEVPLGPFDPEELCEALKKLNLPADLLETLPENARELAHRPRYLELIAHHRQNLGDYAAVTPEVLHWLDLCDKVGRMREGITDWGPVQYQEFLRDLAKRWLDQRVLSETSVREILGTVTIQVPNVLAELRSEGVLSGESGNYTVQSDRLALGYGLFLRDTLLQAIRRGNVLSEVLHDLLAPLGEGDEAVNALRAASTLMLIEDAGRAPVAGFPQESKEVIDVLLWEWLNSRNLGRQDLEAIYELRRLLFSSLLRRWREIWSKARRDNRMREISVMVFGEEAEPNSTARSELRTAIQGWLRLVPLEGGWYQCRRAEAKLKSEGVNGVAAEEVASLVKSRLSHPSLGYLRLRLVDGLDVKRIQSLCLYLISRSPGLPEPDDLLAFSVVRSILEESSDSGAFWIVRQSAESWPYQWFGQQVALWGDECSDFLLRGLRELVRMAGRADLARLLDLLHKTAGAEERSDSLAKWPTRKNYKGLLRRSLRSGPELERFTRRMATLVDDPSLPKPPADMRLDLGRQIRKGLFSRVRASPVGILRDTEALLPALAAWAPSVGAQVVRKILRHLPKSIQMDPHASLLELRGHAILVRGNVRAALQEALCLSRVRHEDRGIVPRRELTLALLPAASFKETTALLTVETEELDHLEVFELAGFLRTEADRLSLVGLLQESRSSLEKRRLRLLLCKAGGAQLPSTEAEAILETLRQQEVLDSLAALMLAVESKVEVDPQLLFPIARGEGAYDGDCRRHASFILVEQNDHKAIEGQLDHYWVAVSAARKSEDAVAFLDEISASLNDGEHGLNICYKWDMDDLPPEMMEHFDQNRAADWVRAISSHDDFRRRHLGGLIRPTFEWCLRNAAVEQAKALWRDVSPFQRARFGGRSTLTIDGVDWVLHALNHTDNDDDLARSFLATLVLDARTDLELFEIALGSYFQGGRLLQGVARELSASQGAEKRARATAVLGWLGKDGELLEDLLRNDSSVWVREQAEIAMKRHKLDAWSRAWLEGFLTAHTIADRWAAGQLFLACADQRINEWAWKRISEGNRQRRLKGEAYLLLMAAQDQSQKKSEKLKSVLLGHTVSELSTTSHPWRRDDEWILNRYGRRS